MLQCDKLKSCSLTKAERIGGEWAGRGSYQKSLLERVNGTQVEYNGANRPGNVHYLFKITLVQQSVFIDLPMT